MAHWQFRPLNPNENSGSSTVDDNFADEERTSVEILIRETLQNPLDARSDGETVCVKYRLAELDASTSQFAKSLFIDEWDRHAIAGKLSNDQSVLGRTQFLVIEDFGTSGLEGQFDDSSCEGNTENWNAFWFREGEGAKPSRSNGGAGQGKITLYLASEVRSVLALTVRRSDGKQLAFGCCRFKRNYKLEGKSDRWAKEARWGAVSDPQQLATPITDMKFIEMMKHELGLDRGSKPGTSFIVPLPVDGISEQALREAVINEFYFALSRGRLTVHVGNIALTAQTVEAEAVKLGARCRLGPEYRSFLRSASAIVEAEPLTAAKQGWNSQTKLKEDAFTPDGIVAIKEKFERREPVSIELPLPVREKGGGATHTSFRVVVQQAPESDTSHELFVRQDLAIDGEKRIGNARALLPVMALTFVADPVLSDLLVCAEEPTHRTWNGRRPKVQAKYSSPDKVLNAVRNAAFRILQLIAPAGKRDESALAMYFADPSSEPEKKRGSPGTKPDLRQPDNLKFSDIPAAKPKPVKLRLRADGFDVSASQDDIDVFKALRCQVEVAYATVRGDSFKQWDAADFWLDRASVFPITASSVEDLERDGNVLRFTLVDQASTLKISGFDANRQLDIRLKYREVSHETDI